MSPKLSKALRGKRRWIGVSLHHTILTRKDCQSRIDALEQALGVNSIRLYDLQINSMKSSLPHLPDDQEPEHPSTDIQKLNDSKQNVAILCVLHVDYLSVRSTLSSVNSMETYSMVSLTSSGKIRLVRSRLGLTKPKRKK